MMHQPANPDVMVVEVVLAMVHPLVFLARTVKTANKATAGKPERSSLVAAEPQFSLARTTSVDSVRLIGTIDWSGVDTATDGGPVGRR